MSLFHKNKQLMSEKCKTPQLHSDDIVHFHYQLLKCHPDAKTNNSTAPSNETSFAPLTVSRWVADTIALRCVLLVFDLKAPLALMTLECPDWSWIIEWRDDLCDELIIDRVIGLASHWARGGPRFCLMPFKRSHYSAARGRQRANSRSNMRHGEHTRNYPWLNGTDFTSPPQSPNPPTPLTKKKKKRRSLC